jgi:hypothetical protein
VTAPSYTTDLATISAADALGTWVEPSTWTGGAAPALESDYFLQGTNCVSKAFTTGTPPLLGGSVFDNAAGVTVPTDGAVFVWFYYQCPNAVDTEANGGVRLIVGSGQGAFYAWKLKGKDTYTYGGWLCLAANPNTPTTGTEGPVADYTVGAPTATKQWFGIACNVLATSKGSALGVDAVRYGRGTMQVEFGSLADGRATFTGAAAQNDGTSNRWGLFQAVDGGYLQQGLFLMGTATNAVDFRDSNVQITIANTKKVSTNFNTFEVRNASSVVSWTNVGVQALGTVSRGRWLTTNNATINLTTCSFTDMGTFGFLSNSTILTSTFRRCQLVTQSSATFTGCTFDSTADSVKALLSNNPGAISNCTFVSSGTKHAIEISTAGTYSFSGNTFTGYASTDGSTGNECIYNNSGGAVTLNVSGGTTPTIRNGSGATTTVNSTVTVTVTPLATGSEVRAYKVSDGTELAGIESSTGSSFAMGLPSGVAVNIVVLCYAPPKIPVRIENVSFTVNQNLNPFQRDDPNFKNA